MVTDDHLSSPQRNASRHPYSVAFENPSELTLSPEERILDFELEEWVSQRAYA